VIKDGAEYSNVGLPEEVELRLRSTAQTVTMNKAPKRHSGKKIAVSEQSCRQKECDGGQKNITQSTPVNDKCITLVSVLFHTEFSYND